MSENLAKYAQKIDFSKPVEAVKKEQGELSDDSKSDSDSKDSAQSNIWPWDSVRNKLRNTYQEICVLADVLAIAKDKRYMVLFTHSNNSLYVQGYRLQKKHIQLCLNVDVNRQHQVGLGMQFARAKRVDMKILH